MSLDTAHRAGSDGRNPGVSAGLVARSVGKDDHMSRPDALSTLANLADTGVRLTRDVRLPDVDFAELSIPEFSFPDVPDVHLPDVIIPDLAVVKDTVRRRPSWLVVGAVALVTTVGIVVIVRRRRSKNTQGQSPELASVA